MQQVPSTMPNGPERFLDFCFISPSALHEQLHPESLMSGTIHLFDLLHVHPGNTGQ
jgi:hypothetical protein